MRTPLINRLAAKLSRAWCKRFGHRWGDWHPVAIHPWPNDGFEQASYRCCRICPAVDRSA